MRWPPPRSRARRQQRNPRPTPDTLLAASTGRGTAVWHAGTAAGAPGAPRRTPPPAERRHISTSKLQQKAFAATQPLPTSGAQLAASMPEHRTGTAARASTGLPDSCVTCSVQLRMEKTQARKPQSRPPGMARVIQEGGHQLGVCIVHSAAYSADRPPLPLAHRHPHFKRRAALPAEPDSRVALRRGSTSATLVASMQAYSFILPVLDLHLSCKHAGRDTA